MKLKFEGTKQEYDQWLRVCIAGETCPFGQYADCCEDQEKCDECIRKSVEHIQPKRWRAERGENYFFVGSFGTVDGTPDCAHTCDEKRYDVGNYFKTMKEAEACAVKIRKVFEGEPR